MGKRRGRTADVPRIKDAKRSMSKGHASEIKSKFIFKTLSPVYHEAYEFDQCWHGCDKVSYLVRKDETGLFTTGGGGS